MKRGLIVIVAIVLAVGAGLLWLRAHPDSAPTLAAKLGFSARQAGAPLTLYGNVEIRQVDLAFGVEGLIADMLVEEGDRVAAGQVLARLDPSSFTYGLESAEANLNSARAKLAVLLAGNRQQDIDRSRALVAEAEANLKIAELTLERNAELLKRAVNSQAQLDTALAGRDAAQATLEQRHADLSLMIAGARQEEIDAARANVAAAEADVALKRYRKQESVLNAPNAGVIFTRIREAGAFATANAAIYTLSVIDPVWVRAYVDEPDLGRAVPGAKVTVTTDLPGGHPYEGVIGWVSPTAEFTPRNVETPQLRTALVYRLRVIVGNPDQGLRQGMPVTVTIPAVPSGATPAKPAPPPAP